MAYWSFLRSLKIICFICRLSSNASLLLILNSNHPSAGRLLSFWAMFLHPCMCPSPDRVGAVQNFPQPKNVREVRQFLGLASYYRRFVKGYATLAQPLHALTKANSRFNWTIDCQSAFDSLKTMLLMSPISSFPISLVVSYWKLMQL